MSRMAVVPTGRLTEIKLAEISGNIGGSSYCRNTIARKHELGQLIRDITSTSMMNRN